MAPGLGLFSAAPADQAADDARPNPLLELKATNPLLVGAGTATALVLGHRFWARFLRRIPNADSLTPEWLGGRSIKGIVTRRVDSSRLSREAASDR